MFKVESKDSLVRCNHCGKEERVTFIYCMRNEWPKCCGYTMRLVETKADIEMNVAIICADAKAQGLQTCSESETK